MPLGVLPPPRAKSFALYLKCIFGSGASREPYKSLVESVCHKFWGLWLVEGIHSALMWLVDNTEARLAPGSCTVQYSTNNVFSCTVLFSLAQAHFAYMHCRATSRDVNILELHISFGQSDNWSGSENCKHIMFGIIGKLLSRWTQLWMNYSCYFWYE